MHHTQIRKEALDELLRTRNLSRIRSVGSEYSIRNPTGCNEQLRSFKITPMYESNVLLLEPACSLQFVYVSFGFLDVSCFPLFVLLFNRDAMRVCSRLTPSLHNIRSDLILVHTWGLDVSQYQIRLTNSFEATKITRLMFNYILRMK